MFDKQGHRAFSYWMTVLIVIVGWLLVYGGGFAARWLVAEEAGEIQT
jgi:uncharacterized membrane protein